MGQILAFTAIKKHPNQVEILWRTRQMGTKIAKEFSICIENNKLKPVVKTGQLLIPMTRI